MISYHGQFNTERSELKEYRFGNCTVRTWKRTDNNWPIFPWLFSVQKDGEDEKSFTGVPNYCESRRVAMMRGYHRAKWLNNNEWDKHYKTSQFPIPLPGTYQIGGKS